MRNIHDTDAGFLPFMRQIENASSICPLLDNQPLAAIAIAVEIIVADQNDVVRFRLRLGPPYADQCNRKENQLQPTQCAPLQYPHTQRKGTGWPP